METYSTLASIFTVLSFFAFAGIVFWAYSARRKHSFEKAANEPFAIPDEAQHGLFRSASLGSSPAARGSGGARPGPEALNGESR
jgi:cytochrome c oxidase cbb3-type subunit 4